MEAGWVWGVGVVFLEEFLVIFGDFFGLKSGFFGIFDCFIEQHFRVFD